MRENKTILLQVGDIVYNSDLRHACKPNKKREIIRVTAKVAFTKDISMQREPNSSGGYKERGKYGKWSFPDYYYLATPEHETAYQEQLLQLTIDIEYTRIYNYLKSDLTFKKITTIPLDKLKPIYELLKANDNV